MSNKVRAFRGLIYSKFDSESAFARAIGWSRQTVNKLSNGKRQPNLGEIEALAKALDVSEMDLIHIFLANESPNEQPKKSA